MIFHAVLFCSMLLTLQTNAFYIGTIQHSKKSAFRSTCRYADEGDMSSTETDNSAPSTTSTAAAAANDILNSPAFLKRKLDVLRSDLGKIDNDINDAKDRLAAGREEWGPQLDDLQKEYKNIQDRMNKQNQGGDVMATTQVVREMLSVLDNYDRAFGSISPESDEQRAIEAEYKAAYQMILDTFAQLGVEEVKTLGSEFDYEVHQAVMQKPSDEYEEGIVCEEFQKGFKIGNTLIRAAMVAVAA